MAGNIKLKQGTVTHAQDNTSSTLGNGGAVAAATNNLANSSNLDEMVSARLTATFATTPTEGATVALYFVPKLDGANLAIVDLGGTLPENYHVGNFQVGVNNTSSQIMDIDQIPVSAYDYQAVVSNLSGNNISAGWKLDLYGTQHQYT